MHATYNYTQHLEKLQEFWSTLDNIDRSLWVVGPRQPSRATSFRQINLGNECSILLSINVYDPRSLPECRFLGPDSIVDLMKKKWKRNSKRWTKDKSLVENLENLMETSFPGPPDSWRDEEQVECGICYAQCLPINDELGAKSGSGPDYTCDNSSCNRAFHSVCLGDWLRSITTTRQSFDVLFGNCPYCSGPVAVKVDSNG
ncbi:Fanconi anemia complex [Macleaya cordata]|uniref:Fanconi anemia complex n=1 Tax=Macleaya cordata TaxID=56857 RepID=A0A200R060_MACCD|nr:Fanconi anemia complex [Macleaya cordata]